MYYIKKYADCWAIHNDDNGKSRKLTDKEVEEVKKELSELENPKVRTVFADQIKSLKEKP